MILFPRQFLFLLLLHSSITLGVASREGKITGGHEAQPHSNPYVVSLQTKFLWKRYRLCTGSILSQRWILSAGHCVTDSWAKWFEMDAIVGAHNLADVTNSMIYLISRRIAHPSYRGAVGPYDIAMMKTSRPIIFSENVQPINLPKHRPIYNNNDLLITGWGDIQSTLFVTIIPNKLQEVQVTPLSYNECYRAVDYIKDSWELNPLKRIHNLCTGPISGGIAGCTGDSGGPLVQYMPYSIEEETTAEATTEKEETTTALASSSPTPMTTNRPSTSTTGTTASPTPMTTNRPSTTTTGTTASPTPMTTNRPCTTTTGTTASPTPMTTNRPSTTTTGTTASPTPMTTNRPSTTTTGTTASPSPMTTNRPSTTSTEITASPTLITTNRPSTTTKGTTASPTPMTTDRPFTTTTRTTASPTPMTTNRPSTTSTGATASPTPMTTSRPFTITTGTPITNAGTTASPTPMTTDRSATTTDASTIVESTTAESTTVESTTVESTTADSTIGESTSAKSTFEPSTTATSNTAELGSTSAALTTMVSNSAEVTSESFIRLWNSRSNIHSLRTKYDNNIKTDMMPTVIGVLSWGVVPCGERGAPTIYSNVTNYMDFINKYLYT